MNDENHLRESRVEYKFSCLDCPTGAEIMKKWFDRKLAQLDDGAPNTLSVPDATVAVLAVLAHATSTSHTPTVLVSTVDQADYLLEHGLNVAAATVAGAVLENGLRSLAARSDVAVKERDDLSALKSEGQPPASDRDAAAPASN